MAAQIIVEPAGAGTVTLDDYHSWNTSEGAVTSAGKKYIATATANRGFVFDHFEVLRHNKTYLDGEVTEEDYRQEYTANPLHGKADSSDDILVELEENYRYSWVEDAWYWIVSLVSVKAVFVPEQHTGLILRSASTGVILRSASTGAILRDA